MNVAKQVACIIVRGAIIYHDGRAPDVINDLINSLAEGALQTQDESKSALQFANALMSELSSALALTDAPADNETLSANLDAYLLGGA